LDAFNQSKVGVESSSDSETEDKRVENELFGEKDGGVDKVERIA
jgi:hypothetical protein